MGNWPSYNDPEPVAEPPSPVDMWAPIAGIPVAREPPGGVQLGWNRPRGVPMRDFATIAVEVGDLDLAQRRYFLEQMFTNFKLLDPLSIRMQYSRELEEILARAKSRGIAKLFFAKNLDADVEYLEIVMQLKPDRREEDDLLRWENSDQNRGERWRLRRLRERKERRARGERSLLGHPL